MIVLPPLPLSPPPTPPSANTEEETFRPTLLIDDGMIRSKSVKVQKQEEDEDEENYQVDSCIRSSGFRPSDDTVVEKKRKSSYWSAYIGADEYDEYDEYDDGDGFSASYLYRYVAPVPVYIFNEERKKNMTVTLTRMAKIASAATGEDRQNAIEVILDYLLTADFVQEYFDWAVPFRDVMKVNLGEYIAHPKSRPRVRMLSRTILNLYFGC